MSDTTYTCPYCRMDSDGSGRTCPNCGAPVDIRLRTTASGWTEMPPVADMARLQFGQCQVQIQGTLVPVAELSLVADQGVYFTHNMLLWSEPSVSISAMSFNRPWARHRAGMPLAMLQAAGPGRLALSHESPGEMIALPLAAGAAVDVREHAFVAATHSVRYDWVETGVWFVSDSQSRDDQAAGLKLLKMGMELAGAADRQDDRRDSQPTWHYPLGQYMDRFTAPADRGLVLVQVSGNAYLRDLAEGESMLVKPPALLFKDPSVAVQLHVEYPAAGLKLWKSWGNRYLWLRVFGPGRVGVQSCYDRLADPGTDFRDVSVHTDKLWT
jgi:uncharacterized protein (AIM24 family)